MQTNKNVKTELQQTAILVMKCNYSKVKQIKLDNAMQKYIFKRVEFYYEKVIETPYGLCIT